MRILPLWVVAYCIESGGIRRAGTSHRTQMAGLGTDCPLYAHSHSRSLFLDSPHAHSCFWLSFHWLSHAEKKGCWGIRSPSPQKGQTTPRWVWRKETEQCRNSQRGWHAMNNIPTVCRDTFWKTSSKSIDGALTRSDFFHIRAWADQWGLSMGICLNSQAV